jgi:hypothetical protein
MSRLNDGTVVPMSAARREAITGALADAAQDMAPFERERFIVTCIRWDGDYCELVATLHVERNVCTVLEPLPASERVTGGSDRE